jgi:hypothetical protein
VADPGESTTQRHHSRSWLRWLLIGLGTIFLLLLVFHGPILRSVIHSLAAHFAAQENLRLEFRVEGDVLSGVVLRNVHATAIGPSVVQSLDADLIRADYSLRDLAFHGTSDFLKDVELRNVTAVLDPAKAAVPKPTPPPNKITLPAFFPDRLEAANVNLTIRGQPEDTVLRNFNLGLYPDREGALRIDKLQIPNVHTWTDVRATTTYAKKNLFLRNLTLDEGHHFQTVNIDASKASRGTMTLEIAGSVGEGKIEGNLGLSTTKSSFTTTTKVSASGISFDELKARSERHQDIAPFRLQGVKITISLDSERVEIKLIGSSLVVKSIEEDTNVVIVENVVSLGNGCTDLRRIVITAKSDIEELRIIANHDLRRL